MASPPQSQPIGLDEQHALLHWLCSNEWFFISIGLNGLMIRIGFGANQGHQVNDNRIQYKYTLLRYWKQRG
jgi:hypothetical protein